MKVIRTHDYRINGYGNVKFIKVDIGSGHSTFDKGLEPPKRIQS
jgi:hypothetical protein